jgi:hypothetical protein
VTTRCHPARHSEAAVSLAVTGHARDCIGLESHGIEVTGRDPEQRPQSAEKFMRRYGAEAG